MFKTSAVQVVGGDAVDDDALYSSPSRSLRRKIPRPPAYDPVCLKIRQMHFLSNQNLLLFLPFAL